MVKKILTLKLVLETVRNNDVGQLLTGCKENGFYGLIMTGGKKTDAGKKKITGESAVEKPSLKKPKKTSFNTRGDFLSQNEEVSPTAIEGDLVGATDAFFEARELLKKTVRFLKKSGFANEMTEELKAANDFRGKELLSLKKIINIHDGMLFFPRRKGNLSLKPVKTSLDWQEGEYPVFKRRVRHYRLRSSFENTKSEYQNRRFSHITAIDTASGEYEKFVLPLEEPMGRNGTLYVSNMNLLFRMNSRNTFHIPHYRVTCRKFYADAFEVTYASSNAVYCDVFVFDDQDICRLLDIILQSVD